MVRAGSRGPGPRLTDGQREVSPPSSAPPRAAARTQDLFSHLRVNGSAEGLDDLALAATRGRLVKDELIDAIDDAQRARDSRACHSLMSGLDRATGVELATLLADLGRSEEAARLFQAFVDALGPQSIRKEGRFNLAELMVELGRTRDLSAVLQTLHIRRDDMAQAWLLTANALNPFRDRGRGVEAARDAWLATLAEMFATDDLEPIGIAPGDEAPFDRIIAGAHSLIESGPLLTVIIPTFMSGDRLATAVESLLAQSYRPLQILIVDDASSRSAAAALDFWTARDPRIEVVHLPENGGPYLARNIAVAEHARGEYVTVHDDDDWSHPRKLELQVAHLQAEEREVANMVNGVRASDDLRFGRVNGNPVWTQQALSSLMVRRSVFDRIGYWDALNRSADAEFNDRIRSWTKMRIPVVGRVPLMFYRVRWGSLSDGEFHRGYMDPRRRWYYQSYSHWHATVLERGDIPSLPVDGRGARQFSAPVDLIGSRVGGAPREVAVDVVLIADFRRPASEGERAVQAVERALRVGLRVGIVQLDSPLVASDARVDARVLDAAMHLNASVVSLKDAARAPLAVVLDSTVLRYLPRERSAMVVDQLFVDVVDHSAELAAEGDDEVRQAVLRGRIAFGVVPQLVAGFDPAELVSTDSACSRTSGKEHP